MLEFYKWLEKKVIREDNVSSGFDANPLEKFKFNDDPSDFGQDHDSLLKEIIKMAMSKAPKETMNFLKDLSRNDDDMRNLVNRLTGTSIPKSGNFNQDEVVPSIADQGKGESEYENQ